MSTNVLEQAEDGGNMLIRNAGNNLPDYTVPTNNFRSVCPEILCTELERFASEREVDMGVVWRLLTAQRLVNVQKGSGAGTEVCIPFGGEKG
jgi:hypothetical protein